MVPSNTHAGSTAALLLCVSAASAAMLGSPNTATAVTGPWQENEQSRVRLVSPWAEAPRADELRLGLEFELRPGWHVEARRTVRTASAREETEELAGAQGAPAASGASGSSLLKALVAGLLLALTPPLLVLFGLRLLAFGRLAAPGVRRGALASVVGALLGFGGVALVARGQDFATWGAQLQEPVLVTLLALANLALAFIAWGLLGVSTGEGWNGSARDHVRPEIPGLAAGLLTAFLATGWSVPGMSFEPAAMLTAGLGASLPYLLLAAAPALALRFRRLAGRYRLKEGLGFLALVGLVWLLYLLTGLVTPEGLTLIELMLLVLGLLAWGRTVVERRAWSWLLGLLLLAGAVYVLYLAHLGRVATGVVQGS